MGLLVGLGRSLPRPQVKLVAPPPLVCERPNKGNKAIEREVIASYQIAQSLGFKGDFRSWEHLLRIHE
jgi:hypothetical protein